MASSDSSRDQVEQVLAALGRIRGRRGPRPGPRDGDGWGGPRRVQGMRDEPHPHHRRHGGGPEWFGGPAGRLGGPARMRLLEALAAAANPLSVSEVAEAVGVDQPRASRLIQQAAEQGLVVREPDPDDARRTRVSLTPQGAGFAKGFRGHRHELISSALDAMSDDERAEFVRLFTQFAANWPDE